MKKHQQNESNSDKLMAKYSYETQRKAKELRIIDDALFRLIAERKGVCQEILRTLLDDDELEVVSVTAQASISSLERGVTLDALCKLSNGTLCNIEMQKTDNEDDIKRVRFHAAMITANKTKKRTRFADIPSVKILYITEYDALENNQTITHVTRCQNIKNQYIPVDDGEDIIFANTAVKDGTKKSGLLQLFLRNDSFDSDDYPELSRAMYHFKKTREGVNKMCESIETYANERSVDAVIYTCIDFNKTKDETIKYVKSKYETLSDSYILERVTLLWKSKSKE